MLQNRFFILLIFSFSQLFAQQKEGNKCGTLSCVNRILQGRTQKNEKAVSTRPYLDSSIISRSGRFRIHFDRSGINMPAYESYPDSVAKTFEYVWEKEIGEFGFPAPPSDNGIGGGNEIDIYIMNLSRGVFGFTDFDNAHLNNSTPTRYTGFINIDNDYSPIDYRTSGLKGMLVTAAHEFFHVIQVGNYGLWGSEDGYFYEMTAEAFEPAVFPLVKDYLYDTKTYFENIQSIPLFLKSSEGQTYQGYERAIFGIYLMKKYSPKIMKDIWEELKYGRPVVAVQKGLEKNFSSIEREYSEFSFWNYCTGPNADSLKYYSDAKIFPPLNMSRIVTLSTQSDFISQSQRTFTSNYIKAIHSIDTVYFIISNTNYADAMNYSDQVFSFQLHLSPTVTSGLTRSGNSIYAKFSSADQKNWSFSTVNNVGTYFEGNTQCFPNPFNPKSSSILFSIGGDTKSICELAIFASSMDLIFNGEPSYKYYLGNRYAEWNGRDSNGNIVGSGVYIYILKDEISTRKGKFAVIR